MPRPIYKFQFKQLSQKEESQRMPLKVTGQYKKQWVDNKLTNLVEPIILLKIKHITRATNQETDQMDQLQELTQTKVEFIAQEDQSAVLLDQVPEPEPTVESQTLNLFLAWSSAHASQIYKMSNTPD